MLLRLRATLSHLTQQTSTIAKASMSTFTLPNSSCSVHLPADTLTQQELLDFPAFKTWINTLQHSLTLQTTNKGHPFHSEPYKLRGIQVQSIDRFGGGKLGFVKLKADVKNDKGEKLPGSIFLRGGAVAMMIILQPDDVPADSQTDKHVILTLQPRIPTGSLSMPELPAGMLDDEGNFAGGAAKEIKEEVGLEIPQDQLLDMTALAIPEAQDDETQEKLQRAVYTSGGGQDEFMVIFLHERRVKRDTLKEWTGKLTGLRDEGEKITLKLVRLEHLYKEAARDSKALCALALYHGLKGEGKI